jgi:hypothetical protein
MLLESIIRRSSDIVFSARCKLLGPHRARRTRLYCVGAPKSGTHSIAAMFSGVRSEHEPQRAEVLEKVYAWQDGHIGDQELKAWLRARDRQLALEVDSSSLNFEILDFLLREFPDARYVLTIRDCYSWCNSAINHTARYRGRLDALWLPIRQSRYRPDVFTHAPEEQLLKDNGFYTLDGYFSYWTRHNTEVIEKVAPDRLLVIRTDQIPERAFEIADFAGLPRRAIRPERTHEYKNPTKHPILRQIDRKFVEAKVEKHCRQLMTRFFPEIKSLDEARL